MGSLNRVQLIGNLGRDMETTTTPSGVVVGNFSLATTESWTDKSGTKQEKTEWHRVQVWDRLAESLAPYLTKGKQVYVEGKLQTREYEKDGQKHYSTEIKGDKIVLLGSRRDDTESQPALPRDEHDQRPQPVAAGYARPAAVDDDDIPF